MSLDFALAWAIATALVAGFTRGFSGFGGALIFVPLVSAVFGPRVSAPTLLIVDGVLTLPYVLPALRACIWRQVAPLAIGATLTVPLGVVVLDNANPLVLRWALAVLVAALLVLLISGWRHSGRQNLPTKIGLGLVAGVLGGAAQMSGPPVVAYWLGSGQNAALVRANLFGFFALTTLASGASYALGGMITGEVARLSLILGPFYAAGLLAGGRLFRGASDRHFRLAAYGVIAVAIVVSLPLFDPLFGR
ncbi:sulfite exporter TauE/SafE family protein [Ancylobacter sp. A5.8]|uniref:sulfite exporter TauE/SafE family protein n=1 Tax=Ancylobacter gelatini TaxID=2919920 RepID=UPI001F4EB323|nr:sulfite exporter TauE/SafE family protein [Ancylobacter gelatini]MCJ8144748.1 sulfite exporter TauE/SafE family protein [Ancylobacter gelatini]